MSISPVLHIDLNAIAANYALLRARTKGSCGAVVKADGYGLGAVPIARVLAQAGCADFFVATLDEAVRLRAALSESRIMVFHGPYAGEEKEYAAHRVTPVLNSLAQLERWESRFGEAWLHLDTGMTRLGLDEHEALALNETALAAKGVTTLMTHLACAYTPRHPKNHEQFARFARVHKVLPSLRTSIANSSGLFLPHDFHGDIARPGCALYGINVHESKNPLRPVATLTAPILQMRTLTKTETIGYDATVERPAGTRLATVQCGYADGFLRRLSKRGFARVAGIEVPLAGRVSMDMIMLDVSEVPEAMLANATHVNLLDDVLTVDRVASAAGTIGYEIFTRIGARVTREYGSP